MEINEWCKNCAKLKNCGMRIPCGHFEPKKPRTNFQRITASPESLAEFIIDKLQYCKRPVCPICPVWEKCDGVSKDAFVEWLMQESDTE